MVQLGVKDWAQARVLGAALGMALIVSLILALLPPYATDMAAFKMWTRTITLEGLHNVYNGTWPETYSNYPPVILAAYGVVGQLYLLLGDQSFALDEALTSPLLTYLIKLPGIAFHLLTGFALFRLVVEVRGFLAACTATVAYLFNPAALFDLAYWGHPNPVYAFFLLLAVAGVASGGLRVGWGALAVAAMSKPQAWSLIPLLTITGALWYPWRAWLYGLAGVSLILVLVLAPFAVGGRLQQLATLPAKMNEVWPVLSANAHNFWWLVSWGHGINIPDSLRPAALPLPVTWRTVGFALWGGATLLALAALLRTRQPAAVYEAAAFVAFAFIMLITRVHENYVFMVLPLGALAAAHRPALVCLCCPIDGQVFTR